MGQNEKITFHTKNVLAYNDCPFELTKLIVSTGDCLTFAQGMQFSTFDADHDLSSDNCAVKYKGAWWYNGCHLANLNGAYLRGDHSSYADGIEWNTWTGYYYSLQFTEMKIAPMN